MAEFACRNNSEYQRLVVVALCSKPTDLRPQVLRQKMVLYFDTQSCIHDIQLITCSDIFCLVSLSLLPFEFIELFLHEHCTRRIT